MTLSRREMLQGLLGAPLAAALTAGCRANDNERVPEPRIAGGFVGPSHALGHRLRGAPPPDEAFAAAPARTVDVAVVGAGPAGLSAAWRLRRRGLERVAVLELENEPGGTSVAGASTTGGFPWGAHYITSPLSHQRELIGLLREMDVLEREQPDAHPRAREALLVREPKERLFYKGFWYPGLYLRPGASETDLRELARFEALVARYAALRDAAGRRAFALPLSASSDDAELTALDRISAAQWLTRQGFRSPRLLWMLDYGCRDDYGLTLEHTSAWALLFYHAARFDPEHEFRSEAITWPEGNGALIAHLASAGAPVLSRRLVLDVVPQRAGAGAALHVYNAARERLERVQARRVIVAAPRFVAARIVRPLREAGASLSHFDYGAWLVANLTLRARPVSRGSEDAWDNVLHDSPSLGYVTATHQRGRSFGPSVWTYYLPLTDARASDGRRRLWQQSYEQCREAVLADLSRAHPDLEQHVERVDIKRWGHGMIQPRVGSVWSRERRRARDPLGPLHFAHSDLSGVALFEEAFDHGVRAADEVADALGFPRTT